VEVAKSEKQRLKQQQQHKKQLIEKMRAEQNAMAEAGEVGAYLCTAPHRVHCTVSAAVIGVCMNRFLRTDFPLFHVSQAARTQNRLQFLLRQAEIFQHFAPEGALDKAKGKK
jgi:hypothetical protein